MIIVNFIIWFYHYVSLTFSQPISIEEKIAEELKETDDNIDENKQNPKGNCSQFKLVKDISDLDELIEDNNSPAFVDTKYDDTPYDIEMIGYQNIKMNMIIMKI